MKKLKLFGMSFVAMFMAILGVNAACDNVEAGAYASITNGSGTTYCQSVKDAVDTAASGATVNLLRDFVFTDAVPANRIEINNKNITFNFNTYKITATQLPSQYAAFVVSGSSEVTFTGSGGIENQQGSSALLVTDTANVTIAGGNFIQSGSSDDGKSYAAISVYGNTGATLTVEEGEGSSISVNGGIGVFGTSPKLYLKSGTITADSFAVSGNGSTTTNSTIEISGGSLKSNNSAAIYHPQSGTLTVTGGEIEGKIGIVARGGTINVSDDAKIKATGKSTETYEVGDATDVEGKVKLPGGVGLLVDDTENYPAKSTLKATVDGGHFDTESDPVMAYKNAAASATNLIEVKSGSFNKNVAQKYLNSSVGQSENGIVGNVSTITVKTSGKGSVKAPANAAEGEVVTLTVLPGDGYRLYTLSVTDAAGNDVTVTNDKFTMPNSNVTVSATFRRISTTTEDEEPEEDKTIDKEDTSKEETPNTLDNVGSVVAISGLSLVVAGLGIIFLRKREN